MTTLSKLHTRNINSKLIIWFLIIFILPITLYAQTVSNVNVEQVDKTIRVSYDLDKQAEISLHLSIDGGKTYTELHKLSGDVGKNVTEGHKTIVWDVLAERESLVGDDVLFLVKAEQDKNLDITVKGISFKMIFVEGGSFTMGCTSGQGNDCYSDENPTHQVTLSNFYLGETEVTQALWIAVMGSNPSRFKNDNLPVENVSWNDCQKFVAKLDSITGRTFRLPTEAEWEYAARGGNNSKGFKYSGSNNIDEIAWYWRNCGKNYLKGKYNYRRMEENLCQTRPVKQKKANELGLYDMSGNVWEWCSDWKGVYVSYSQTNPTGPSSGSNRVSRGGCWSYEASYCRVATRFSNSPNYSYYGLGFRLALSGE